MFQKREDADQITSISTFVQSTLFLVDAMLMKKKKFVLSFDRELEVAND